MTRTPTFPRSAVSSLTPWLALLAVLASGMSCLGPTETDTPGFPEGDTRVLFIGNSLTYVNDLPAMVAAVARQAGNDKVSTAAVAYPDFSLEDHWNEGTARRALADHRWEYVVMQQGPSSLPENQVYLANWSATFAPAIRAAGAEPVLYMVWPSSPRSADFPAVRQSYRNAAAGVSGVFAPAGDAWTAAWETDPALPLYSGDGFHPSVAGTYLAAIVILNRVTGIDPLTLPAAVPGSGLPAATVRVLQQAARAALDRNPARP
ncbi:MAG: hypothetical protein JNJ80_05880 [Gemmatimonadetes bacterium]|nr:hypothetical protein [Gemmatimonadota bacterium]